MYKTFFNLKRNPFDLTPDPTFFVRSRWHDEALAAIYYGVRRHKGFVVLTGEVGTGKTLVLRCLLSLFKQSKGIGYCYVFNGLLSPVEFLKYILRDLGLPVSDKGKDELLLDLGKFLVARCTSRQTTMLIVDEAHHLSADILEELRLLSNLETTDDKLLQIILAGQPELDQKLDSPNLRQLKQRIAVRANLHPFDEDDTKRYIESRLQFAGADTGLHGVFTESAVAAIYSYSHGLPRLINTICENALITAFAQRVRTVTPEIIEGVAREFRLDSTATPIRPSVCDVDSDIDHTIEKLRDLLLSKRVNAPKAVDASPCEPVQ